ncbi:MAG TPA: YdeI/OmpD-associated family protein [Streptosporangiaceae bacterium]
MEFTAILQLDGKTATGIRIPEQVVTALGGGKRIPVSVTINGTHYASTITAMRGEPKIPVSAEIRSSAGIAAGDSITVELERDDTPRTVDLPAELADALRADPAASSRFAALSYSNQRRQVLSITGARTAETRARRLQRVLDELHTS